MPSLRRPSRRRVVGNLLQAGAAAWLAPALPGCAPHAQALLPSLPQAPAPSVAGAGSLRVHAAAKGLLYGCAVDVGALGTDPAYAALVKEQSSIVVGENAMKFGPLRPARDRFRFDEADALVLFAEGNRIKVRGHTLCWHRQLPAWFAAEVTPANAAEVLGEHIDRVVGRYSGRMHSWDVVNEAVLVSDGRPDGLRKSPWLELMGPDYIEFAFRRARMADPQALLCLNDYGLEPEGQASEQKRAAVLMLLRRLKRRDVPIDAVGLQSHVSAGPDHRYGAGLSRFMAEAVELGLQVFVTEMDVNDRDLPPSPAVRDHAVAEVYGSYGRLVLAQPAVSAMLTWGITDRRTWLNGEGARRDHLPERCLPFDAEGQPVEAFSALRAAFDDAPMRKEPGSGAAL